MSFETTHWSLVVNAGLRDEQARAALGDLCQTYWRPLFLYLRGRGFSADDAEDAVQGFFVHVMDHDVASKADPARGRFRTFLLTALNNYVAGEYQKRHAQKRGGNAVHISLDSSDISVLSAKLTRDRAITPEDLFDRQWAVDCTRHALDILREEYMRRGALDLFDHIKPGLGMDGNGVDYARVAQQLGMKEGALRVAVLRLRKRYAEALREQIARTVADPDMVADELRHLIEILSR